MVRHSPTPACLLLPSLLLLSLFVNLTAAALTAAALTDTQEEQSFWKQQQRDRYARGRTHRHSNWAIWLSASHLSSVSSLDATFQKHSDGIQKQRMQ